MSASPLPAIQTSSPQSSIAKPVTAQGSQCGGQTAFDTHLQNAQHDQAASSDDTQVPSAPNAVDQNGNSQASSGQACGNPIDDTKRGDASTSDLSQDDAMITDSDGASGTASLAGAVLSLIDQAAGDVGSSSTAETKSTSNKQAPQAGDHPLAGQVPSSASSITPIVLPPPVVPSASSATKGNSDSTSNANAGVVASAANNNATANAVAAAVLSPLATQSSSSTTTNSGGGDATGDAANAASAAADNSAALPSVVDSAQALASVLSAGSHATSIATTSQSQSTPDLAALRGMLDTTAVAVSSGTSGTGGHSLAVNSPVGSTGFAKELGQQISWLSGQEVKQAQIRLNPQDLGPLDVKVSVDHGRVDVAFMTQHPAAAAAVQQGLGQLNQMLGGQGLSLGHATVGQHAQQQFGGQQQQHGNAQVPNDAGEAAGISTPAELERVVVGLVDAFA
jgi:flagellar hook-length control protein FliK